MNLKSIKDEILSQLSYEEIAYGEILYNNGDCQILSQSAVSIVYDAFSNWLLYNSA